MERYRYLVVGGGMAGAAGVEGIRAVDPGATIGLVSAEDDPPYDRPPLSKGLWKATPEERIWRPVAESGATLHLGRRIVALDAAAMTATDDQGRTYAFERALLATGGRPRRLGSGEDGVAVYYRTMADYRRVRELAGRYERFAVIGGSFIGSEMAAALAMNGKQVVLVTPAAALCASLFPAGLARSVTELYREKGVDVRVRERVVGLEERSGGVVLTIESTGDQTRSTMTVDAVVAGLGIRPNTEVAAAAGLDVGDGIIVDRHTRTSHPDIFAAGDVASFPSPATGEYIRVEHEDNANAMGRTAGRNMAGDTVPYDHLPFFYSDLFELGYEAVGMVDSRLEMIEDWSKPNREGVIYYLAGDRVRGVLLFNVWDRVPAATGMVLSGEKVRPEDLRGRIG